MLPMRSSLFVFFAGLVGCTPQGGERQTQSLIDIQARVARLEADGSSAGRYQIVNGTPGFARNIMLLDTRTGRSWVTCESKDAGTATSTNWCAMVQFGNAATP